MTKARKFVLILKNELMRGLTRLIMMFAPMIINQITRYQRNKQRQQHRNPRYPAQERQYPRDQYPRDEYPREEYPREAPKSRWPFGKRKAVPAPVVTKKPELTEEEKNFRLKEEDIMIDPEVLDDYEGSSPKTASRDVPPIKAPIEKIENKGLPNKTAVLETDQKPLTHNEKPIDKASDLDLRDIFFDEDDEDKKEN